MHEGQELVGPNGFRLRLDRVTEDVLEMEARYTGEGSMPPPHLHPRQVERFTVLEGGVRAIIDGHERRYSAGETFEVPAGTVHQMAGDGPARMHWEVRPALNMAQFFVELYSRGAAEDSAGFLERYSDVFRLATDAPQSAT